MYAILRFGSKWSEVLSHVLRDENVLRVFGSGVQETAVPTECAWRQGRQKNGDDYTVTNFTHGAAQ